MEYRQNILICIVLVALSQFRFICSQPADVSNDGQTTGNDLRMMLKTVLEQNRRLTLQNNRLQKVWLGMQQMCSALSMQPCNCEQGQGQTQTIPTSLPLPTPTTLPKKTTPPLRVMTIETEGANMSPTPISVTYAATPDHTTEWIALRRNGGMWRTAGKRVKDIFDPTVYTSSVEVPQMATISSMYFRLYNDDESVNLRFNVTELDKKQTQDVIAPDAELLKINTTFVAPSDSDLNITGIVNRNAHEFDELAFVEVFFTGLNTSASPPTIFEVMNFNSDGLALSGERRTNTTSNMQISLRHPYVQYGGILTVRMPYRNSITGMVEELFYGPFIKIYSPDGKYVVQNNTIGIFPLPRQTIIFPPMQSVICAAMGNPRPEVQVLKMTSGGLKEQKETETVILDSYMNMKVLSLNAALQKKTEGRYVCRATNGNQTIDAPTEVTVLEPAVFDERKTGVTKNSSDVVVISCKARGKPKPMLQLRLYDEYGPDLAKSGMFQVWRSDPSKFTSRITLSISPVDEPDIHSVFCTSTQGGPNAAFERSTLINVFPGMEKENNWELYSRVQKAAQAV
ncbi:putative aminophospholipid-translocase [Mactra antiquata]